MDDPNAAQCSCANKFETSIAELRTKASAYPHLADVYRQCSLEVRRIATRHTAGCIPCQQAVAQQCEVAA